jgi:hypothetical protein
MTLSNVSATDISIERQFLRQQVHAFPRSECGAAGPQHRGAQPKQSFGRIAQLGTIGVAVALDDGAGACARECLPS